MELSGNLAHIPVLSQSCLEAGNCDYGLYPLESRFYMDQVPLDLFQFGKRSLNPKGAGFCWVTGADKKATKRFGTIQLWLHCKNGSESLTHADLVWPLKPKIKGAIKKVPHSGTPIVTCPAKAPKGMTAALDKRNYYLYDPKGYSNNLQCLAGLENHISVLKKAGLKKSVLGLDNWSPHLGEPFGKLASKAKIKLI